MPFTLTWLDAAVRLLCALAVGTIFGLNRGEHGRAAGLRTSVLVCLAACVAMLQVNLLLPLVGRPSDSFVMNDLMSLPLGVLSGMGFIGAGAIVRRDTLVVGVTTAATMWFLTIIGLCIGGGQIALGLVGSVIGLAVIVGMKSVEDRLSQDRQARLRLVFSSSGPAENEVRTILQSDGFRISSCGLIAVPTTGDSELLYDVRWRTRPIHTSVLESVRRLTAYPGIIRVEWTPHA